MAHWVRFLISFIRLLYKVSPISDTSYWTESDHGFLAVSPQVAPLLSTTTVVIFQATEHQLPLVNTRLYYLVMIAACLVHLCV